MNLSLTKRQVDKLNGLNPEKLFRITFNKTQLSTMKEVAFVP